MSVAVLWWVLRDPTLDYRFVALGAVAADPLDVVWGGAGPLHSIVVVGAVMAIALVVASGRPRLRRVLIAAVFGLALHVLLDLVWSNPGVFWWPLPGGELPSAQLPVVSRGPLVGLALEVVGLIALGAWARAMGLHSWGALRQYLRDGRTETGADRSR